MQSFGKLLMTLLFLSTLGLGLTACEDEGPMEEMGEEMDEGAEQMGDEMEEGADEAEDEMDY